MFEYDITWNSIKTKGELNKPMCITAVICFIVGVLLQWLAPETAFIVVLVWMVFACIWYHNSYHSCKRTSDLAKIAYMMKYAPGEQYHKVANLILQYRLNDKIRLCIAWVSLTLYIMFKDGIWISGFLHGIIALSAISLNVTDERSEELISIARDE